MFEFFGRWRGGKTRHRSRGAAARKPSARPRLEVLEDRTAPALLTVAQENALVGAPPSQWDISGSGDGTLQGFATNISVNQSQTVSFKITDTSNSTYHIDIYRMGYYQGNGARLVTTIPSSQTLKQNQPAPLK